MSREIINHRSNRPTLSKGWLAALKWRKVLRKRTSSIQMARGKAVSGAWCTVSTRTRGKFLESLLHAKPNKKRTCPRLSKGACAIGRVPPRNTGSHSNHRKGRPRCFPRCRYTHGAKVSRKRCSRACFSPLECIQLAGTDHRRAGENFTGYRFW